MLVFSSKKTFQSSVFPEVRFTIRVMTEGRRMELRSRLLEYSTRLSEIYSQIGYLMENKGSEEDLEGYAAKRSALQDESELILMEHLNPSWFQWGCISIEGLKLDDKIATPEDWKDLPSALFHEILGEIKNDAELSGEERKNSRSPTTSGDQDLLNGNITSAGSAGPKAGTETGTVANTIQT